MDIFSTPANVNVQLIAAAMLDTELPRDCPELGVFGGYDLPDTLGLGGPIETEQDFQLVLDYLPRLTEDEIILVPLPGDVDFYMLITGTHEA